MRLGQERLAYVGWFVLILACATWLGVKHASIKSKLKDWTRLTSALERVIAAARRGASTGCVEPGEYQQVLLQHGIKSWPTPKAKADGRLELFLSMGQEEDGILKIEEASKERWVASATVPFGSNMLEIRALLFPTQDG